MRASYAMIAAMAGVLLGCEPADIRFQDVQINIVSETIGLGAMAHRGQLVTIAYKLYLPNGEKVLSHDDYRFEIGEGTVLEGIDEAVTGMRVNGRRVVKCPPHMHWGRPGYGDGIIPPATTLTIDVELLAIE